jgi:pimeloyl-ACP methyl ester carboxylesterase
VEQVLDALGLVQVVLVGHSLGGAVAFELASRRPDLVSALVAEDVSPSLGRPSRPVPDRPQVDLPFDWAAVVAIRAEADRGDPAQWSALSRLAVPTLIVAGGPTSTLEQSTLAQAAELIPSGSIVTLDAGHYVHRERPDEFCDAVLGWLDDILV